MGVLLGCAPLRLADMIRVARIGMRGGRMVGKWWLRTDKKCVFRYSSSLRRPGVA